MTVTVKALENQYPKTRCFVCGAVLGAKKYIAMRDGADMTGQFCGLKCASIMWGDPTEMEKKDRDLPRQEFPKDPRFPRKDLPYG